MSDRVKDMLRVGKVFSEEEVAVDLGFKDVFEFRRWQTKEGEKVWDLEVKLKTAESDRDQFWWTGRRMELVLEKVKVYLEDYDHGPTTEEQKERKLLLLAIEVVCGRGVDWNHDLRGWLDLQSIKAEDRDFGPEPRSIGLVIDTGQVGVD